MTAILRRTRRKMFLEIDKQQFENLLDIGGFYSPKFIESLKASDMDIQKGAIKKRKSLMEIADN